MYIVNDFLSHGTFPLHEPEKSFKHTVVYMCVREFVCLLLFMQASRDALRSHSIGVVPALLRLYWLIRHRGKVFGNYTTRK